MSEIRLQALTDSSQTFGPLIAQSASNFTQTRRRPFVQQQSEGLAYHQTGAMENARNRVVYRSRFHHFPIYSPGGPSSQQEGGDREL